jgi:hypothetical protein
MGDDHFRAVIRTSRAAAIECSPQPALSEVEGAQAVGAQTIKRKSPNGVKELQTSIVHDFSRAIKCRKAGYGALCDFA